MKIIKNFHKTNAIPSHIPEGNYLENRIGFWALVKSVNSLNNTVTVVSDTGFEYPNIQVKSDEWVTVNDQKDYIPSQRNLPPKNSRVFVLTPTRSITGAFVLCSGFSRGDENIRTLWAKNESELEEKNNCREIKTQGGWDIKEEYKNGNSSITSNDENIVITINTAADNQKGQKKEVSINAWDNSIVVDESGIVITDKNKNVIKMTATDIQVMADAAKKIKIGNATDTIKGILTDMINVLNSFQTAGSPANHTAVPGQFSAVTTKLNAILE